MANKMSKEDIDKLKEKIEAWETKNVGGYQKIFPTDVLFIYV